MAKSKFRPLHDRVVVKRIDAEEKTKGGIIIPDSAKEKPSQGEITAVGPGGRDESGKLIPIDVKVGDRVLFGKWSGTEVKLDGDELLIMKESDIMGVLTSAQHSRAAVLSTVMPGLDPGIHPFSIKMDRRVTCSKTCFALLPDDDERERRRSHQSIIQELETWLPRT